jgi:hypothetical protein
VKPGDGLPHQGRIVPPGEIVEVPAHIVPEILHLVEPVDAADRPIAPPTNVDAELAKVRPHERVSILRQLRTEKAADLADLDARIAKEAQAANEPTAAPDAHPVEAFHSHLDD